MAFFIGHAVPPSPPVGGVITQTVATSSVMPAFADVTGAPMLMVNEDTWSLLIYAGKWSGNYQATIDNYFVTRGAQGYNSVEITLFSSPQPGLWTGAPTDGSDWDGTYPFATNTDPTTAPNATFWARRDYFFQSAFKHGFVVVCNVTTPQFTNGGTLTSAWTSTQWTAFGTFLGNRYKTQPNIFWIVGDDYFGGSPWDGNLDAWLTALQATGDTHQVSIQNPQETTSRVDIFNDTRVDIGDGWSTFGPAHATYNWLYTYNVTYPGMLAAYEETSLGMSNIIATIYGDGGYNTGTGTNNLRREIWWVLTSGGRGFMTGDNDIYPWDSASEAALTGISFYTSVIPAIVSTFTALPKWWLLEPDSSSQLVTAGRGTQTPPIVSGGGGTAYTGTTDAYVTAARVPDGSLAVIYSGNGTNGPGSMSITIDQTKMKVGYTATWVDPASGATTPTTAGSTYNSAGLGTNSVGDTDWLLVLKG